MDRIRDTAKAITNGDDYQKLQQAGEIVSTAISANRIEHDGEEILHLEQDLNNVKQILNDIRKNNLDAIQEHELNGAIEFYEDVTKKYSSPQDIEEYAELFSRAKNLIHRDSDAFEEILYQIHQKRAAFLSIDKFF